MEYQRTTGPENAHLKPDVRAFTLHEKTLTLNTHILLRTSLVVCLASFRSKAAMFLGGHSGETVASVTSWVNLFPF